MKKILTFASLILMAQAVLFAQKEEPISEKDVNVAYVKDFNTKDSNATHIKWYKLDEERVKVRYTSSENEPQAIIFSKRGSETHYYVDNNECPQAIREHINKNYGDYKLKEVWIRKQQGKFTYQARIAQTSGILWWKKEKNSKILNYEVDYKFINEQ